MKRKKIEGLMRGGNDNLKNYAQTGREKTRKIRRATFEGTIKHRMERSGRNVSSW